MDKIVFASRFISWAIKSSFLPDASAGLQCLFHALDMAVQTNRFFIRADFVCIKNHFCCDTALLELCVTKQFFYFFGQFGAICLKNFRGTFSIAATSVSIPSSFSIRSSFRFSPSRMRDSTTARMPHEVLFQGLPDFLFIYRLLFHCENFRTASDHGGTDIIWQIKFFRKLLIIFYILCCNVLVVFQRDIGFCEILISNKNINFSTLYIFFEKISNSRFKNTEFFRHFDVGIKIAVVDGLHLNRKLAVALVIFISSKACHTFYHNYIRSFLSKLRHRKPYYFYYSRKRRKRQPKNKEK